MAEYRARDSLPLYKSVFTIFFTYLHRGLFFALPILSVFRMLETSEKKNSNTLSGFRFCCFRIMNAINSMHQSIHLKKNHRQHNNREINTSTPFDSSVESIIPDEYMWNLCSLFYARFCVFFVSSIFLSASKHCSWIRNWCFPILALSLSLN